MQYQFAEGRDGVGGSVNKIVNWGPKNFPRRQTNQTEETSNEHNKNNKKAQKYN